MGPRGSSVRPFSHHGNCGSRIGDYGQDDERFDGINRLVVTEKASGKATDNQPGRGTLWHWPVAFLRAGAYTIGFRLVMQIAFKGTVTLTTKTGPDVMLQMAARSS